MGLPQHIQPFDFPDGLSKEKPKPARLPLIWASEAKLVLETNPIIKGLIDQCTLNFIYGPSNSGKSFFTIDLAYHVAAGESWRGHRVTKCLVVYVASEAGASIMRRFVAWRDNRLGETTERLPLAVLTRGPNLLYSDDVQNLIDQLRDISVEAGLPLGLVIFDTLSRSVPGADENSAQDMTKAVAVADKIRDDIGASTLFVHHTGKDGKLMRGSSVLFGAADMVLKVDENMAKSEKVRDGQKDGEYPFRLKPIVLGEDQDGDPVTTCLLEHDEEGGTATTAKRKREPSGGNQRVVFNVLQALIAERGEAQPATSAIPAGVKAIKYVDLLERCVPKFPGEDRHRVKQILQRSLTSLQGSGFATAQGDLIWLV